MENNKLIQYSKGEEIFNSITHGLGIVISLIGSGVIVTLAHINGDNTSVMASVIYSVSLCLLYTMSTLYHAFPFEKVKKVFKILDHSSIFLLIAGTYTPFMLLTLRGNTKGFIIFIINWTISLIGIILNSINLQKFTKISLFLYVLTGWSILFVIKDVINCMYSNGIVLLFLGGVFYTIGIIFYLMKKVKYSHSVWHLFVLVGSVLHYLCIVLYVI